MKLSDAKKSKICPRLGMLFAKAANGDIPMDTKVTFLLRAKEGFESENVNIRSRIGDIMTAEATLEQIQKLEKEKDVYYIEASTPMRPS